MRTEHDDDVDDDAVTKPATASATVAASTDRKKTAKPVLYSCILSNFDS